MKHPRFRLFASVLLLICLCGWSFGPARAASCGGQGTEVVTVDPAVEHLSVGDKVSVLSVDASARNLEDILKSNADELFEWSCETNISPPSPGNVLFLKLRLLTPATGVERIIIFDDTYIDRVDMIQPGGRTVFLRSSNGRAVPYGERTIKARMPAFRVALTAGKTQDFYFRIDGADATAIAPVLMSPAAYESSEFNRLMLLGFIFGIISAVGLFLIYMYGLYRLPELIFYAGYIVCIVIVNLAYEGLITQFVPLVVPPVIQNFAVEGLTVAAVLFALQMSRLILQLKLRHPVADRTILFMIIGYSSFVIWTTFFTAVAAWFSHAFIIAASVYLLAVGLKLTADGDRVAAYFSMARFCHLIGTVTDLWFHHFPVARAATWSAWSEFLHFCENWIYYLGLFTQILFMAIALSIVISRTQPRMAETALRDMPEPDTANPPPDNRFISRVKVAIRENIGDEELNVSSLARVLATSESSLRRRLQIEAGMTPADLIRAERLEQAYEMLLNSAVSSVQEAANAVGFRNAGHFSRLFKKTYGTSPKEHLRARNTIPNN